MSASTKPNRFSQLNRRLGHLSLRTMLIVPFVAIFLAAVILIGWLSWQTSTTAVGTISSQLRQELTNRIVQELNVFLSQPVLANHINVDADLLDTPSSTIQFQQLQRHFWNQLQQFPTVSAIGYISRQRPAVSVNRTLDGDYETNMVTTNAPYEQRVYHMTDRGFPSFLKKTVRNVDTQNFPSLVRSLETQAPAWTPVNINVPDRQLFISAVHPTLDSNRRISGTYFSEIRLWQIDAFLRQLEISPRGQALIIEHNGLLIASSNADIQTLTGGNQLIRVNALEHDNPSVRLPTQFLAETYGGLDNITASNQFDVPLGGEDYFLQVTPYVDERGIDWLIILTMPASDFLAPIDRQRTQTSILIFLTLVLTLGVGLFTAEWIIRPIQQVNQTARALADGRWHVRVEVDRRDELGQLALSFNRMAAQLQEAFAMLEKRVAERTAELEEAKDVAEKASLTKSQFLAHMSHELRTPLNAILGFTQLMRHDDNLSTGQLDNLRIIHRSGEHLLSLINDILTMSKIEAGYTIRLDNSFDLVLLLEEIREMFLPLTLRKDIFLEMSMATDLPPFVITDERKLRQILTNLLSNALKFTTQGTITLDVTVADPPHGRGEDNQVWLQFVVADTGAGIDPEELSHLFEPFVQARPAPEGQIGTGLGLPISQEFVHVLGGQLAVESQLGQGSQFSFAIPVTLATADEVPVAMPDKTVLHLAPNQREYRILVVEDKQENRRLLRQILERVGFTVADAYNGQEAIMLNATWRPDLIWMDMRLPVLDGYEATRQIRENGPQPQPVIIALTASAFEEDRQLVLEAGCDGFMRKPFREQEILRQTARYLGVSYTYEEPLEPGQSADVSQLAVELLATTLAPDMRRLPVAWLTAVGDSAERARDDEILAKLAELEATELDSAATTAVATGFKRLLEEFRFDLVYQLCYEALEAKNL